MFVSMPLPYKVCLSPILYHIGMFVSMPLPYKVCLSAILYHIGMFVSKNIPYKVCMYVPTPNFCLVLILHKIDFFKIVCHILYI